MSRNIAVSFDYRCPFARNAHEAMIQAERSGALPDVRWRFLPFSLDQVHVPENEPPVWERPSEERGGGVLALCYGIAIRDTMPEKFLDAHEALFAARHDHGRRLNDVPTLHETLSSVGVDPDTIASEVDSGQPLTTLAAEHDEALERWKVFGVPTFIEDETAVFVRFMERGRVDDLTRMIDLLQWERFNEFKRTTIAR